MTDTNRQTGLLAGSTTFFIASLVIFVARFATSVIIARALGAEGKGIYGLTLTAAALLVLAINFGIGSSFTYLTASRQFTPSDLFTFAVLTALLFGLVGDVLFYYAYRWFLADTFLAGIASTFILLVMAAVPINLLTTFLASILLGLQRILAYNVINVVRVTSNLFLVIGALVLHTGVVGTVEAWLVSLAIAFLLALAFLRQHTRFQMAGIRRILRPSFSFGLKSYASNLLTFFNYRFDSFLVNFFSGPTSVGLYSTGVSAAELIWYIPNAVSGALFPKVSSLEARTANQLTAQVCRQSLMVTIPLSAGFGVAGTYLIPLVYGAEFKPSVAPFLWLLPGIVTLSLNKIISANLSGRGMPQYSTYTAVITVIITVVLDITMIPIYGIVGAAIASSIAYTASAILSVYWFTRESQMAWRQVLVPKAGDFFLLLERGSALLFKSAEKIKGSF